MSFLDPIAQRLAELNYNTGQAPGHTGTQSQFSGHLNILSNSYNESSLLVRLKQEDSIAWQQFVKLFGPLIFHWCQRCQISDADAADIMQDVLVKALGRIDVFENRKANGLRGWLWQITQNRIKDHFRANQKRDAAKGGTTALNLMHLVPDRSIQEVSEIIESAEDPTEPIESQRLLHRAMEQIRPEFSERSWQAFWDSVVFMRETSTIAAELGISPAGVRQAKRRILRRLRLQLREKGLEE